jgi:hypothetical protein
MCSENLDAIETARRLLVALAAKHDPDPADVDKLRQLAPPLAHLPTHELATNVMRLAQKISAVTIDSNRDASADIPSGKVGRCGLRRTRRPRRAKQPSRSAGKRQK